MKLTERDRLILRAIGELRGDATAVMVRNSLEKTGLLVKLTAIFDVTDEMVGAGLVAIEKATASGGLPKYVYRLTEKGIEEAGK